MARRKKVRDELEELDEAYLGLAGKAPKRGCSSFFSLLLIILLLAGILLAVYLISTGSLLTA